MEPEEVEFDIITNCEFEIVKVKNRNEYKILQRQHQDIQQSIVRTERQILEKRGNTNKTGKHNELHKKTKVRPDVSDE